MGWHVDEQNDFASEAIKDSIPEEWEHGDDHHPNYPLSKVGQGVYTLSARLQNGLTMPPSNLVSRKWQSAARKALGGASSSTASTMRNPSQESSSCPASAAESQEVVTTGPDAKESSDEIPSELPHGIQQGPHGTRQVSSHRRDHENSIVQLGNEAEYLKILLKAAQLENGRNKQTLLRGQEEYENKVTALEKKYEEEYKQLGERQLETYRELQTQYVDLVRSHSELQTQHAEVEERYAELQTQHVEVGDRHVELQTQQAELREKHSLLQTQHAEVVEGHAELQTQLAELEQRHSELEAQSASAGNSVHKGKVPNDNSAVPRPQVPNEWLQQMCIELRGAVRDNVREEMRRGPSLHLGGLQSLSVRRSALRRASTFTMSSCRSSSSNETDRKGSGDESAKSEVWDNAGHQHDADSLPCTSEAPKAKEPELHTGSPRVSKGISEGSSSSGE